MRKFEWVGDRIKIDPPKRTKKITGTRFASVMGLNSWSTPFQIWCEVTKTYEKPFEDTIYTAAGKIIEPKQAEYMKRSYGMSNLVTPTDVWGENYFSKTFGDFFPNDKVLGGMWDYLLVGEDGKYDTVLEMKTSKRTEDWNGGIPEYYALQAALYAYLLGVDNVIMVASFLNKKDYENPELFVPSASNTITVEFKVSERYPDFKVKVNEVLNWWRDHVETGISPPFDEKKDAEILAVLRENQISPDADIEPLIEEAEQLKAKIEEAEAEIADDQKRYKKLTDAIRNYCQSNFRDGDEKTTLSGRNYDFVVSKSTRTGINEELLKKDGLFEKYSKSSDVYTMRIKKREGNE